MRRAFLFVLLGCALAAPASAQSLFSTRGLGTPVAPVDARARVLGGLGVGLFGTNPSMVNPAELAGFMNRSITAALQPVATDVSVGGEESDISGTRFPIIHAVLPMSNRLVLGAGYGGVFDQNWGIVERDTVPLGAGEVGVRDQVRSSGGVAQARLSAAYALTERIAVGAAFGLHTGSQERILARAYEDTLIQPYSETTRWEYSGLFGVIGARWDLDPDLRVAASATFGGDIEAEPREGDGATRSFDLPVRVNLGASGMLGSELGATLGAELMHTSAPELDGENLPSQNNWRVGGGLEWLGVGNTARSWPIRVGGQWAQLPYRLNDESQPTEWSVAAGFGVHVAAAANLPVAMIDFGVERGGRTGFESTDLPDGLDESFWRATISLSLFGR